MFRSLRLLFKFIDLFPRIEIRGYKMYRGYASIASLSFVMLMENRDEDQKKLYIIREF